MVVFSLVAVVNVVGLVYHLLKSKDMVVNICNDDGMLSPFPPGIVLLTS